MKPFLRSLTVVLSIAVAAAACNKPAVKVASPPPIDRANLDTTCAACTDFFQFANGGWLKTAKIPAAYSVWGAFTELNDRNEDVLHKILDQSASDLKAGKLTAGTSTWKVGAYYAACMDTVAIDQLGSTPLKAYIGQIDAIKTSDDLVHTIGALEHAIGIAPWADGSEQDPKEATAQIAALGQGGLSLPERDYYLKQDTASKRIRDAFVTHMTAMFQLLGHPASSAAAEAKTVLAFETQLAQASKTPIQLRDPVANYHKMTLEQVTKLTPHFAWATFFKAQNAPDVTVVDVGQPEFFKAVDGMVTTVPVADWKVVLRWRVIHGAAGTLSTPFVNENFKFAQLFGGAKELLPRWKRCSRGTDGQLGELLGQEYVTKTFTPEAKARAVKIVGTLVDQLHDRLQGLDWMSSETKTQAIAKLGAFARKIGYPDKWRDYSTLEIKDGQYAANVLAAMQFESQRNWTKIGKPVDRGEWGMSPPTVNAYYNPQLNEIVFPAGILQPPFYDPNADDAVNYGAMGAVIGHEMTHGFDDQGRQFDKDGNLKDWWTKEDAAKYNAEAKKVIDQFDAYTVVDSTTHVKGALTLGENIADFGGLTVAFAAMEKAIGAGPHAAIDGFSPEQRFFLGWAQVWRQIVRPESARMRVNVDPHSPGKWRVNGPLGNMPEFQKAWGCKDTDTMVRPAASRARIW